MNRYGVRCSGFGFRDNRTPNTAHRTPHTAFTLIELLITSSIVAIVAIAIVSTFAGGLKVYERILNYAGTEQDVLIALEKMEKDVRNVLYFSMIDFAGDKNSFSFAGLVKTLDSKGSQQGLSLGRILYYLDDKKRTLLREEQDYSLAVKEVKKGKGNKRTMADIKGINFSYYYFDLENKEYAWKEEWEPKIIKDKEEDEDKEIKDVLLGVKVNITFKEGERDVQLDRTIFIPTAVSKHMAVRAY